MPLNTRSKKREIVNSFAEFAIDSSAKDVIKLNIANDYVRSTLMDVSVIGCAVDSPYLIPPGVILHIKIDPKPFADELKSDITKTFQFKGKVKSCVMMGGGRYRLGVQFVNPDKDDIDVIDNFVKSKERRKTPRWKMGI